MNIHHSRAQRALILAAGVSRRLYPLTLDRPKCLLEVGGKAIIDHQIEALTEHGVRQIHVVVGYYRERLIEHLRRAHSGVDFVFHINQRFFETNTAASLDLALNAIDAADCVLMNGDVVYPPELLSRLLAQEGPAVFAVDARPCGDEEVKVSVNAAGRILEIGKEIAPSAALGEFIGVARFGREFAAALAWSLREVVEAGGAGHYFEAAIQPLCEGWEMHVCDVSDLPCIEIDFPEDYERAGRMGGGRGKAEGLKPEG